MTRLEDGFTPIPYGKFKSLRDRYGAVFGAVEDDNIVTLTMATQGGMRWMTVLDKFNPAMAADLTDFRANLEPVVATQFDPETPEQQLRNEVRASYSKLRPDQVHIHRWGAMNVSGPTDAELTNLTPAPNGYPVQKIDYTVPAGKVLLLKGARVSLDLPGNAATIMASIRIGNDVPVRLTLNTNNPSEPAQFDPPISIPALTPVRVFFHSSSNSPTATFIRWSGIEENA